VSPQQREPMVGAAIAAVRAVLDGARPGDVVAGMDPVALEAAALAASMLAATRLSGSAPCTDPTGTRWALERDVLTFQVGDRADDLTTTAGRLVATAHEGCFAHVGYDTWHDLWSTLDEADRPAAAAAVLALMTGRKARS